ncbi:hypothetical protein [Streptomyces atratus]
MKEGHDEATPIAAMMTPADVASERRTTFKNVARTPDGFGVTAAPCG